jgi:hypothetical protein
MTPLRPTKAKSYQDPFSTNKMLDVMARTCQPSSSGSLNRRIAVQAGPGKPGRIQPPVPQKQKQQQKQNSVYVKSGFK